MRVVEVAGPCPIMVSNKEASVYDKKKSFKLFERDL